MLIARWPAIKFRALVCEIFFCFFSQKLWNCFLLFFLLFSLKTQQSKSQTFLKPTLVWEKVIFSEMRKHSTVVQSWAQTVFQGVGHFTILCTTQYIKFLIETRHYYLKLLLNKQKKTELNCRQFILRAEWVSKIYTHNLAFMLLKLLVYSQK